jgi:hypothetical protein
MAVVMAATTNPLIHVTARATVINMTVVSKRWGEDAVG